MSSKTVVTILLTFALLTTAAMLFSTTEALEASPPISVNGNDELDALAKELQWDVDGDGSVERPYVITDLRIGEAGRAGISIQNTDRYIIIKNCNISGARSGELAQGAAILLLGVSNVTIEGNDLYLNDYGISISSSNNISVNNNNIISSEYSGIEIDGSENVTVTNNRFEACEYGDSICLYESRDCLLKGNWIIGGYTGIYASGSDSNTISKNEIIGTVDGIYLSQADDNRLYQNRIESSSSGIWLDSCGADIQGNAMFGCCIMMGFGDETNVEHITERMTITENNTVDGAPVHFLKNEDMAGASVPAGQGEVILLNVTRLNVEGLDMRHGSVIVAFSDNITVQKNTVSDSSMGIMLFGSVDCILSDNRIDANIDGRGLDDIVGIMMFLSSRNDISNNDICFSVDIAESYWISLTGIDIYKCHRNSIFENSLSIQGTVRQGDAEDLPLYKGISVSGDGNREESNIIGRNAITDNMIGPHGGRGISLGITLGNFFIGNVITGMPNYGVYAFGARENWLVGNEIVRSGGHGIALNACYGNHIFANKFVDNNLASAASGGSQAFDDSTPGGSSNYWYGPNDLGNVWSDCTLDEDHDGIADERYFIDGGWYDDKPVVVYFEVTAPAETPSYTSDQTVPLAGTALDVFEISEVSWYNSETGEREACSGTKVWNADVPLAIGANHITIVLEDSNGLRFDIEIVVVRTSGPVIDMTPGPVHYTNRSTYAGALEVNSLAPITGGNWTHYLDGAEIGHGSIIEVIDLFTYSGDLIWDLGIGTNIIVIQMNDSVGIIDLYELTVIYDVVDPTVGIDSPSDGSYSNTGAVTVTVHGDDDLSGVDRFMVSLDGGAWAPMSDSASFGDLSDGSHTVTVRAFDRSGNWQDATVTFTVDTTGPVLTIKCPSSGEHVITSSPMAEWSATDDGSGLKEFQYKLDNGGWFSTGLVGEQELMGLSEGAHTLYVRAYDNAGNYAEASVTFTVDTELPMLNINSPSNGGFVDKSTVEVSWTATDATSGIRGFQYRIDGGEWSNEITIMNYEFADLADGQHTIEVKAIDKAGNEASARVNFAVDTASPNTEAEISGNAGDGGWFLSDVTAVLKSADATSTVAGIEYRLDGGPWTDYSQPIVLTGEGVFALEFRATDAAGNVEMSRALTVSIDRTGPVAEILSPSEGGLLGLEQKLTWAGSDGGSGLRGYEYRVDGGAWTPISALTFDLGSLADGVHTFAVRAVDNAGNLGEEASVSFTIDTTVPEIVSKSPQGDGVDVNAEVVVEFSETVDRTSVEMQAGSAGTITWEGNALIFTPSTGRAANTTYTVVIAGTDLAGNQFSVTWSFKTSSLGSLNGTVVGPDGLPMADAAVALDNGMNTTTDAQGRFSFIGVAEGNYTLSISKEGFKSVTQAVTVKAGDASAIGALTVQPADLDPADTSGPFDPVIIGGIAAAIVAVLAAALVVMRGRKRA